MKPSSSFRSKLLAIVAAASAAPMMGACCETRTSTTIYPTTDGGPSATGEGGCQQFCQIQSRGCGGDYDQVTCAPATGTNGEPAVSCTFTYTQCPTRPTLAVCGRRPQGFADPAWDPIAPESTSALFARMARLEGASVLAFEMLSRELLLHGAPGNLTRGAARAAGDEARHERLMASLAGVDAVQTGAGLDADALSRPLEAIAIENVIEGCVRETFGALVTLWQSQSARETAVRDVMQQIASDEMGHAALAWQIDAWARLRLEPDARARMDAALREAVQALEIECESVVPAELTSAAGVPSRETAQRLLVGAKRAFWS